MRILLALCLLAVALLATADMATARVLRVGTECINYPFNYRDDSGALRGYDVEVARALGERTDRKIEFVCQEWDGMIPALVERKFDVIAASMSITEKRKEAISFSVPYRAALGRFVAAKGAGLALFGDDGGLNASGFAGRRIGVLSYSVYDNWLEARLPQADVARHDKAESLYLALQTGEVDAILSDPVAAYLRFLSAAGETGYEFVGPPIVDPEHFGIGTGLGIRRGRNALREEIDEAITEMIADGTLTALSRRYFPFEIEPKN